MGIKLGKGRGVGGGGSYERELTVYSINIPAERFVFVRYAP